MSSEPEFTISSGNVFADLGLPNPDEELLKAQIVRTLDHLITEKRLTPQQAANALGIEKSDLDAAARPLERLLGGSTPAVRQRLPAEREYRH